MIRKFADWMLWRLPLGILLLAAGLLLFVNTVPRTEAHPEALPDFDYLPQARQLAAVGDLEGCIQLCEDIIEQDLPHAEQAIRLLAVCEEKRSASLYCAGELLRGFATGDASSMDAAAGAVISDLTLYGDVRDLSIQGWRRLTGGETDVFIAVFSAVGLATELADWVDWLPSVLKAFKRSGVLSKKFSKVLTGAAGALFSSGAARKAAVELFGDLATLCRKGNLRRAKTVLKGVDSAKELKVLVRAAERSPAQLHLACRSVGTRRLVVALEELPNARTLRTAARKGPAGVAALRKMRKMQRMPGRRWVKWGARLGKVFHSRHAEKLLNGVFARFPDARKWFFALSGVLVLAGAALMFPPLGKRRNRVTVPSSDASDAPTSSDGPACRKAACPPGAGRD